MLTTKQRLLCLAVFAAMSTACSTGGGNLNAGGGSTIPGNGNGNGTTTPEAPKDNFKKVDLDKSEVAKLNKESDSDSAEPAAKIEYGYTKATPITGYPLTDSTIYNSAVTIDDTKSQKDDNVNYDTITFLNDPSKIAQGETSEVQVDITRNAWKDKDGVVDYGEYIVTDLPEGVKRSDINYYYIDEKEGLKLVQFNHTKIGSLLKPAGAGYYSNLFYKGKDPALTPTAGTATYHGVWDTAQALTEDTGISFPANEKITGAEQLSMAPIELTADFGAKTLKGNFKANQIRKTFAYEVDAQISGNTFSGSATSTEGVNSATISDNATVSGGFFGEKAEELAGKLIGEKAFGVFAAKQTDSTDIKEGEPVPEVAYNKSGAINVDSESVFVTDFTDVIANTQKLPNVDTITLNGVEIDLVAEANKADSNVFANADSLPLQFTRIGAVQADANNPLYTYFYQGQLTQNMPTGTASYEGNWIGSGKSANGTPFSMSKASNGLIKFDADFASKALSGEFLTAAGNNAMILNDVKITGNTFAGQANIRNGGLTNDKDGSQQGVTGAVNISGGFFGDNANELGGQFNKEDNSFAGVFAGKQTK